MKKAVVLSLILSFASASAFALSPLEEKEARYEEMKKIKTVQREAREAKKAGRKEEKMKKTEPGFWDKEAERSGLGRASASNFFKNLNPAPFFRDQQEKYKARKAASEAGHASGQAQANASPQSAVAATT
ncbi:MAG: hypothetical protein ACREH5_00265 [Candidatus Omnitrophota bacterium]